MQGVSGSIDISGLGSKMDVGKNRSMALHAHVVDVGVFLIGWDDTVRISVPAGEHVVAIWATLTRKKHQGLSHARLWVGEGQAVGITWRMPITIFGCGAIVGQAHGDPSGWAAADQGATPAELGPCKLTMSQGDASALPGGV